MLNPDTDSCGVDIHRMRNQNNLTIPLRSRMTKLADWHKQLMRVSRKKSCLFTLSLCVGNGGIKHLAMQRANQTASDGVRQAHGMPPMERTQLSREQSECLFGPRAGIRVLGAGSRNTKMKYSHWGPRDLLRANYLNQYSLRGGERPKVEGNDGRWRRAIEGGGERPKVEGSDRR
jgi:hypothetical protein